jgi:predicted house-cleaning noncanonical NTP pyrophosphatase (MazG superfamily)
MSKLVRDRIPDIIRAKGESPDVRRAHPDEMLGLLAAKLLEEAGEFASATDHRGRLEELADVLEVVDSAARTIGTNLDTVAAVAANKRDVRGSFNERWVWTPAP